MSRFLPEIMAHAHETDTTPGLAVAAAEQFALNAAIEFAVKSKAFRRTVPIDVQCGMTEYPFEGDCYAVVQILGVEFRGQSITPAPGRPCSCGGRMFAVDDGLVRLLWTPSEDMPQALKVRLAIAPKRDACTLDEAFFFDLWAQAVIDGALAKILLMPNEPWTNLQLARVKESDFERAVSEARRLAILGRSSGPFYSRAPSFLGPKRFR